MSPPERGSLLARTLAGSWRQEPPPLRLSAGELAAITPLLLATGGAGLLWRRLRSSHLKTSPPALQLRQAYRGCALQGALDGRQIVQVVTHLRSAGVEPLVVKGWAAARLYPEPGLRPYGDLDLCVRPEQYPTARAALRSPGGPGGAVDLHCGLFRQWEGAALSLLDDRSLDELYERSQLVPIDGVEMRVLSPEDHLRLLCLHTLSHGAWRALWLSDIAVALEARPADFDWDRCLAGDPRRSDWAACSLGLAHQLLGARVEDTPIAARAQRLPGWLVPTVLRQWGRAYRHRLPMSDCWGHPAAALAELRHHWPNGIEATIDVRGPFNAWPRTPFQLAACLARTVEFIADLRKA